MIEQVPEGWKVKKIKDVIDSASIGGTPLRSEDDYWGGDIPWISSGAVSAEGKYTTSSPDEGITKQGLEESSTKLWSGGTVLVAMHGRGTLGHSAIASMETAGNQSICGLQVDEERVTNEYLYYWLQNIRKPLANKGRGATASRQNLNQSLILDTKVPVPPLDEQERIVRAVEERLERVERLDKSVQSVGRLAKEYRDSLTEYLIIGRESLSTPSPDQIPTEDDVPNYWNIKTIGEVSSQIRTGGTPKKSRDDFWGGSIPWKASKHFNENSLQLNESSEYVTNRGKSESTMANSGDVVIVCRGAHTGKVGLAQSKFLFNQDVKVIRLPESIDSEFVARYLSNHTEYFLQKQRGGTTKGIITSHVKNLRIPIPPTEEQKNILDELKSIDFGEVSRAVSDVDRHFEEYRGSVLAHAFSGGIIATE